MELFFLFVLAVVYLILVILTILLLRKEFHKIGIAFLVLSAVCVLAGLLTPMAPWFCNLIADGILAFYLIFFFVCKKKEKVFTS